MISQFISVHSWTRARSSPCRGFCSASEVVRDALRSMEERKSKLAALRAHLAEGAKQAETGDFVNDFSMDALISDLDNEA